MQTTANLGLVSVKCSDTRRLKFRVRGRRVRYGDQKSFYRFQVFAELNGKPVGVWDGPDRTHAYAADARRDAAELIAELKMHQLFVVDVTKKDIDLGEPRECQSCAISQALWRNQERIGLSKHEWDFRVEPYGYFVDCEGVVLSKRFDNFELSTGENGMPDLVYEFKGKTYTQSMHEWAMEFDDWGDSRGLTLKQWREECGKESDDRPYCPPAASFVLDLSMMRDQDSK